MWPLVILSVLTIVTLVIVYFVVQNERKKSFFEQKGIKYLGNGSVRLVINTLKGRNFQDDILTQYEIMKKSGKKMAVSTDFGQTSLILMDPELIKSVLVKDFDHFVDRRKVITGKSDYLFQKMLFGVDGERWKQLRTKMSPTFTTGKIRRMFRLFDASGQKFIKFLESEINRTGNEEIELTEGYSKFTMDIIASAACGIDSEAFNQKEPSLFERMGQGLQFQFGKGTILKILTMVFLPSQVADFFGLAVFRKDIQDFFSRAIKGLIKQRETSGEKGDDFVQLMLEARAGTLKTDENELEAFEKDAILKVTSDKKSDLTADVLDDEGIVANCVLFMLAGFDTTQSLLLFASYALALHQDIQEKLRSEVDSMLDENNGQFTYDAINKMAYLEMIIQETLRFYPPIFATDRCCTMEYKVPGTDIVLKKGEAVIFPVTGLHQDPDFFPEPDKFLPERFSAENKGKVNPYTFLPFGQGPRNCIGMRFALTEAKVVLSYLVHHFKIEPSAKTLIPMKYSNTSSLKPQGGMYLRLSKV